MKEFNLSKYTTQAEKILTETKQVFQKMDIPMDELPNTMKPNEEAIKLVFVGQYSAGKSSIIKMLSGIDTGIGAAITTQKSSVYNWNNLQIIDTPGIQTGLRPDHDEITYDEIGKAALLIFVITNEGFDQQMGEHFRKLAIEQKRGSNMILVINKMDRTVEGNTFEQQKVIRDDICKVVTPYTPEDLYISFLSTQTYDEYLEETDPELKAELLEESGYNAFIDNLNAFVAKKQVSARLQRPLYTLETVLRKAMGISTDDKAIDGAEELINRKLRILDNAKADCMRDIKEIISYTREDIISEGKKGSLCIKIEKGVTEETIEAGLNAATQNVSKIVEDSQKQINERFNSMIEEIERNIKSEISSSFAHDIAIQLEKIKMPTVLPNGEVSNSSDTAVKVSKHLGNAILNFGLEGSKLAGTVESGNILSGISFAQSGLAGLSGSMLHDIVKGVGSFVGFKFAPWGALKWAKALGTIGVVLSIVSVLMKVVDLVTSADKQRENEEKVRDARNDVREKFNDWANQAYEELTKAVETQMNNLMDAEITETKKVLQTFQDRRDLLKLRKEKLDDIFAKEQKLMQEIEQDIA